MSKVAQKAHEADLWLDVMKKAPGVELTEKKKILVKKGCFLAMKILSENKFKFLLEFFFLQP